MLKLPCSEEMLRNTDPKETALEQINQFLQETTAHGFGRLGATAGSKWRLYWVMFCLAAYCVFVWQLVGLVNQYNSKPIKTRMQLKHAQKLDFPVVTICNMNVLRASRLPPKLRTKFDQIINNTKKTSPRNSSNSRNAFVDPQDLSFEETKKFEILHAVTAHDDYRELVSAAHQLEDILLSCNFNGVNCRNSNDPTIPTSWTQTWNDNFGNCYMFNSVKTHNGEKVDLYSSSVPGELHGLTLQLNIEQNEYLEGISEVAGMKVTISDQGVLPFPGQQGIRIMPGQSTGIQMTKLQTRRIDPFKNRSCESSNEMSDKNLFFGYNMTYSIMACKYSCLNARKIERCGCTNYNTPEMQKRNIPLCNRLNSTIIDCLNKAYDTFEDGSCERECPPSCSEVSFDLTVSSARWPARSYEKTKLKTLQTEYGINMTKEEMFENIAQVHVYYGELDYLLVQETLAYTFMSLLSDIGGQMGMWIGISALTCAELIELVCVILANMSNRSKKIVHINSFRPEKLGGVETIEKGGENNRTGGARGSRNNRTIEQEVQGGVGTIEQ
ncbi:amiloride-sensitive sodium channel subunit gamma [Nematostella vectensis]|uniref:amiloride-sensitive sodium channel subunit gamma n=1 Tax=Nematostella vectensis TaxID=45351 RepID=UPI00207753E6|nr:amiloride-sensitive sodium channel subunit gamma [Nematostella vectensis]